MRGYVLEADSGLWGLHLRMSFLLSAGLFLPCWSLPADGVVHDSVKLHNSRANMRGCGYAPGEAAAVAAAASAAAGGAACTGYGAAGCTPSVLIAPTSAAAVQA